MKQVIKLTESDLHKIIGSAVNKILKEGLYDDALNGAESEFENIRSFYDKDELIDRLWYFTGDRKPQFIEYMKTSGNLPDDGEDDINDIDAYAEDRLDLQANYDDFPPQV